ncbi:MAG: hypothetical protein ACRDFZ_07775 [Candidatus Limnocylindria bacterium]
MAVDSQECANCGNANPAWAQVCRSCGAPLTASAAPPAADFALLNQGSLIAVGAALGTIAVAVVVGLIVGGILPPAPPVAVATPTPAASQEPTPEATPDISGSPDPSASEGPILPGTLTFGLGLNADTQRVTSPTDTFTPGTTFAHSIELTAPFGVTQIAEAVARLNKDGSETVVITADENTLTVDPNATVDGFTVPTNALLDALGAGTYVMRVYRGSELLAQGTFILSE